jgi:hypothetical protein
VLLICIPGTTIKWLYSSPEVFFWKKRKLETRVSCVRRLEEFMRRIFNNKETGARLEHSSDNNREHFRHLLWSG